jgi:hypothetical protein
MWLAWESASSVGELAIHKVIVHKAYEDCIISMDQLGVVLSILLAMEVKELSLSGRVTRVRRSLPILLLVLDVLVLLPTSTHDIPLGGVHSGSKKRLKLGRAACEEDSLVSVDSLCTSLMIEITSMLVKQYDTNNGKRHIVRTNGRHIWKYVMLDFHPLYS